LVRPVVFQSRYKRSKYTHKAAIRAWQWLGLGGVMSYYNLISHCLYI